MKLVATCKAEQNRAVIDPWTAVHFSVGLAGGLMAMPWRRSLLGSVIYEAIEQYAERCSWGQRLFQTSGPERVANAVIDVLVFAVGHSLGIRWNRTRR
jgi:hypothetical protein